MRTRCFILTAILLAVIFSACGGALENFSENLSENLSTIADSNVGTLITQQEQIEGPTHILPAPNLDGEMSVEQAIQQRRSRRNFEDRAISQEQLSQILWSVYGITEPRPGSPRGGLRTTPSAGALFPLEIYVVIGNVEGIEPGVYRYISPKHKIVQVVEGDMRIMLAAAALNQTAVRNAPAIVAYAAVFDRMLPRYGERGIMYTHMEVGHSAQNMYLQAEALGLGTVAVGAFVDEMVSAVLRLPDDETPLYLMPFGYAEGSVLSAALVEELTEELPEESPPMVALTFDDGPSTHTEGILDILEQYEAQATFFVVGNRVETHRSIVERAANSGNEIANHSHTHPHLTQQTDSQVIDEITSASTAIAAITGFSPPIYRPPFGSTDDRVVEISTDLGYGIVKWTLDPLDWRDRDPDIIYRRIMSQIEDGSVIVLHDIHPTTVQAMERVIPSLIEQGFKLVTVSELITHRYGGLEAGDIFGSYCAWRIWDEVEY
ncbi:MAG: SagB family peptide dehydrogenase [Defluviitaleaceae bacterium]|nr:SagB family peptide dehydrogenase [Defluviitaleaceae bacterium]